MPARQPTEPPRLTLDNVTCERDDRVLFCNLQYNCQAGTLLQVVGFNGAGKTTLLHALTGLIAPAEGQILWQQTPIANSARAFRQALLYLGHQAPVKAHLTVAENALWLARLQGASVERLDWALEQVDMLAYRDISCHSLSAGQRRRVALAQLYMSQAPLWVLDEPFTAIDKEGVAKLEALLERHCAQGGIAVLTSHQALQVAGMQTLNLADFQPQAGASYAYG